jgi:DNA-binding XRE family transcriptional regulator
MTVAQRVRQLRLALGRSQVEMARLAEITPQAWNNMETGDNSPRVSVAIKLYEMTGVHLQWLYCGVADASLPPTFREALINLGTKPK